MQEQTKSLHQPNDYSIWSGDLAAKAQGAYLDITVSILTNAAQSGEQNRNTLFGKKASPMADVIQISDSVLSGSLQPC